MYNFCTYVDSNYLVRGLALYRSLARFAESFRLWVLCFDDLAYETLGHLDLPNILPISLTDFEEGDEALLQARSNRSRVEYYFTCTPALPLHILKHVPDVDVITYLDADLMFFSSPRPIYEELGNDSILIIGHRFPPRLRHLEPFGIYNVGYLSFRRDESGLQCLNWWRERCIEWCHDRLEESRFADQKYLDDWPERFSNVVVARHAGAGVAPWNVDNSSLDLKDGQVLVDSRPLVFFHFHGFKQLGQRLIDPNLWAYEVHAGHLLKKHIYGSYVRELRDAVSWLKQSPIASWLPTAIVNPGSLRFDRSGTLEKGIWQRVGGKVKLHFARIKELLQGHYWLAVDHRVI